MTSNSQLDWLKLVLVPGLGPVRIHALLDTYGSPGNILSAPQSELQALGLDEVSLTNINKPDNRQLDMAMQWLSSSESHHLLAIDQPDYPPLLKDIHDAPPVLFINGDTNLLSNPQLAMVGSRNPTAQGLDNAYEFAHYLAQTGLTITSGLALGVDGASHQGALDGGGQTIAVTGNGLDRVYPARHKQLAHRIAEQGALVSEFPPGSKPLPGNFPRRNRIISGLSLGTLVVEAAQKSGSLITAYKALEQSREVFAIPGSIHNPLARGCHQLIRQGAKLVETAADIIEELMPIARTAESLSQPDISSPGQTREHNSTHQTVLEAMAYDPVSIDTLVKRTGLKISEISSVLLILELQGKITSQTGGHYIRNAET